MKTDDAHEQARRDVIARLAALSPLEYDAVRVDEAGGLGGRVATLDVVAERSDVGGSSAARVRRLGSACTSRSFGPRAPEVDASAARAAARRSVWSPRAGWTFDGHRLSQTTIG